MTNEQRRAASPALKRILTISILGRLAHDIANRIVYPFAPELAAGLKIPLDQFGALVALRSGVGLSGPLLGALADRIGHRRALTIGLLLVAIGLGLIGLSDGLLVPGLGFVIYGLGSAIYIPTLMAYASERTPYPRRGRVLGTIELSWAISGMIGLPIVGLLIGALGWRAPLIGLAVAAAVCAGLTLLLESSPGPSGFRNPDRPEPGFKVIFRNRSALAFIATWFLVFFAFENVQVGYGSWFESHFGLSTTARGGISTLFGLFELAASVSSSLFLDRLGKKRGVTGGLSVAVVGYLLLVTLGPSALPWALAAISVAFLGFEFSVVSSVSVMSELVPQARGTMMATGVTAGSLGRMAADLVGSALTANVGFTLAAVMSLLAGGLTVAVFALGVKERQAVG
jgi:predicted MFS family arabinose efflux permease